jgi:DNA-binding NarL/FixJ family response regulator
MSKDSLAEHLPRAIGAARRRVAARSVSSGPIARREASDRSFPVDRPQLGERAASCSTDERVARYAADHRLSDRELEVFALAFQGLTDKDIGLALRISHSTVRAHWHRIAVKTGCEGQRAVMRQFAHCLSRALAILEAERNAASGNAPSRTCGCTD